jgi:hypothetical protein
MPKSITLIASSTVGSGGAASIDFTSIPGTYTDLVLKISSRCDNTIYDGYNIKLTFNGNGANYSAKTLGNESGSVFSASSSGAADIRFLYANTAKQTANVFGDTEIYAPNYASSNNKSVSIDCVTENNSTGVTDTLTAGLWSNTSAITQLTLTMLAGSFVQYSTAYLYGIVKS